MMMIEMATMVPEPGVVEDDLNGFKIDMAFRKMNPEKRSKRFAVMNDRKIQKKIKIRERRKNSHRYNE